MIYLRLLWVFFKIGLFTFGGGYAMIPMIKDEVKSLGWITEDELILFIGIGESTPGPFAINIATFVGTTQAGFLGAVIATIGVILPSFIIILLIAKIFKNFSKNRFIRSALDYISPVVVGLIFSAGIILLKSAIDLGITSSFMIDWSSLILLSVLASGCFIYKKINKKSINPILLILVAAIAGIIVY